MLYPEFVKHDAWSMHEQPFWVPWHESENVLIEDMGEDTSEALCLRWKSSKQRSVLGSNRQPQRMAMASNPARWQNSSESCPAP